MKYLKGLKPFPRFLLVACLVAAVLRIPCLVILKLFGYVSVAALTEDVVGNMISSVVFTALFGSVCFALGLRGKRLWVNSGILLFIFLMLTGSLSDLTHYGVKAAWFIPAIAGALGYTLPTTGGIAIATRFE